MEFRIIPSEQTPKVPQDFIVSAEYMEKNRGTFHEFLEFAKNQTNAVGLAANQCSLDGERFNEFLFAHKNMKTKEWSLMIAPKIKEYYGICETKIEGCLTWKGLAIVAERYRGIYVEYYDMDGVFHIENTHGFDAQIWQHEINHLNGVEEDVQLSTVSVNNVKPSRNEKCPCGSDKKYKHCCLKLL